MLIDFGAEFPYLDAMVSRAGDQHYDIALARLHYYQAISSEAYLLATEDPIESAFHAAKLLRKFEMYQLPSLRKQYRVIHEKLDIFLSKLLMKVDSTEEVKLLLYRGGFNKKRRLHRSSSTKKMKDEADNYFIESQLTSTLPNRIQDAITLDYKQVSLY